VNQVNLMLEASGQRLSYPIAARPLAKAAKTSERATQPETVPAAAVPVPEPRPSELAENRLPPPMLARPAPAAQPTAEPADPYRAFFEAHFQKISRKDLAGVVANYADQVTYFGSRVDRSHIQKDEIKDFATSQIIEESVVEVQRTSPDELEFVVLTRNARSQGNQWTTKRVRNTLKLVPYGGSFRIVEQAAKVLSTSNEPPFATQ
jgi:hypothetical protein